MISSRAIALVDDGDVARLHRREDLHVARRVVRRRARSRACTGRSSGTPARPSCALVSTAWRALMARIPSVAQPFCTRISPGFSAAGVLEDAVRRAADALGLAGDADQPLGLVVVGRDVLVADRPVPADAVVIVRLEVVVGVAQLDARVVVGAAADDARAEPAEVAARRHRIRLVGEVRGEAGVEVERRALAGRVELGHLAGAAMPDARRRLQHLEVAHADHRAGLHQEHLHAEVGQHLGDGAAAGPGADDHDVVDGRTRCDLRHSHLLLKLV